MRVRQFQRHWIDFDHVLAIEPAIIGYDLSSTAKMGAIIFLAFRDEPLRISFQVGACEIDEGNKLFDELLSLWKGDFK